MILLGFVTENRDVSIAIAMDRGIEPVAGTWMDGMNADDARKMKLRF